MIFILGGLWAALFVFVPAGNTGEGVSPDASGTAEGGISNHKAAVSRKMDTAAVCWIGTYFAGNQTVSSVMVAMASSMDIPFAMAAFRAALTFWTILTFLPSSS